MTAIMYHTTDKMFRQHLEQKFKQWCWGFKLHYLPRGFLLMVVADDSRDEWAASPVKEYLEIMCANVSREWDHMVRTVEQETGGAVSQVLQEMK